MSKKKGRPRKKITTRVRKLERTVKNMEEAVEYKKKDYAINATNITTTAGFQLLTSIDQGAGPTGRNGDTCILKSIQLKFAVHKDGSGSRDHQAARIALVLDKTPASASANPTYSDIFDSATGSFDWLHFRELDNKNRFVILKEWNIVLSGEITQGHMVFREYYRKFNLELVYNHVTGSSGRKKNMVYIVYISDSATAPPVLTAMTRVRHTDS